MTTEQRQLRQLFSKCAQLIELQCKKGKSHDVWADSCQLGSSK